jgi:hypothetical protein
MAIITLMDLIGPPIILETYKWNKNDLCCNLRVGLATKATICKGAGQR